MGPGYLRDWHFPIHQGLLLQAGLIFNFQLLVLVGLGGNMITLECNGSFSCRGQCEVHMLNEALI